MFDIVRDIPKPPDLPARRAGGSKYPLAEMEVGDSFVVPYGEMAEGEKSDAFRDRIYKSCREYARREAKSQEGAARGYKKEFTAAIMPEDDKSGEKRYAQGDVVVWRDK